MSEGASTRTGIDTWQRPTVRAGVLLGLGIGGFFDGIVFHQVLQWHHMLSAYPDPAIAGDRSLNVLADGLFHVLTYTFTLLGIALLYRATRTRTPSGRTLFGAIVLGWGIFNVVEGTVNHQLLGIHHVWPTGPGPTLLWDGAFLLWGALFALAGTQLVRTDSYTR